MGIFYNFIITWINKDFLNKLFFIYNIFFYEIRTLYNEIYIKN